MVHDGCGSCVGLHGVKNVVHPTVHRVAGVGRRSLAGKGQPHDWGSACCSFAASANERMNLDLSAKAFHRPR